MLQISVTIEKTFRCDVDKLHPYDARYTALLIMMLFHSLVGPNGKPWIGFLWARCEDEKTVREAFRE